MRVYDVRNNYDCCLQVVHMRSKKSSRQVKSVQTAFQIIHLLQDLGGATQAQLSDQIDLAKSTLHNYLGTLESMGYIVNRDGTYHLGLRFFTHGMAAKANLEISDIVHDVLSGTTQEIDLPVWWVFEEFGRGIFVDSTYSEGHHGVYARVGKRSYLHTHAPGKAILARFSIEYVEQIVEYHGLPASTTQTITDPNDLMDELEQIRKQGYALSSGEAALGVQSIGAAFSGPFDTSHAIGVFGHSHDFGRAGRSDEIASHLREAAHEIERKTEGK